ncbi:hypothetical protein KNE206_73670 [Kitasatospora sp. NE20-6]
MNTPFDKGCVREPSVAPTHRCTPSSRTPIRPAASSWWPPDSRIVGSPENGLVPAFSSKDCRCARKRFGSPKLTQMSSSRTADPAGCGVVVGWLDAVPLDFFLGIHRTSSPGAVTIRSTPTS